MAARRDRIAWTSLGFTIVWMTVWAAAILIAIWTLGGAAWNGEPMAVLFLLVWIGAAAFAFLQVGRQLRRRLLDEPLPPRAVRNHRWDDEIGPPK